jgi:hypothetical protein
MAAEVLEVLSQYNIATCLMQHPSTLPVVEGSD